MFPGSTKLASHVAEDLEAIVWDHPDHGGLYGEVVRWGQWAGGRRHCWAVATVQRDQRDGNLNIRLTEAALERGVNGGLLLATVRGLAGALRKLAEAEVTVG